MFEIEKQDVEYIKKLANELNLERLAEIASKIESTFSLKENPKTEELLWNGTLMYRLHAFVALRFFDLGIIKAKSFEDAVKIAQKIGLETLEFEFKERGEEIDRLVEHWEVRVRPALPSV